MLASFCQHQAEAATAPPQLEIGVALGQDAANRPSIAAFCRPRWPAAGGSSRKVVTSDLLPTAEKQIP